MNKLLNYRIAFITILFTAFGGVLSTIMDIESIESWSYAAISSMTALVTSLLISFLLKGKWSKKFQARVRSISIGLFIAFLVSCFLFIWLFRFQLTFEMKEFTSAVDPSGGMSYNTVRYVKGVYYTPEAKEYVKEHPGVDRNPDELVSQFGGSKEIGLIWDQRSRNLAQFYLMLSYSVFVLLFVTNVSLLCEILVTKYKNRSTGNVVKKEREKKIKDKG